MPLDRSKNVKEAMSNITEVNLKDIFMIIKAFTDVTYEDYARKSSTHMPTDSYLYQSRQISKFMMSRQKMSNSHGSVRTQN